MPKPIKTQRLTLRLFQEADREQAIALLRNNEISKTFMMPEFPDDAAAGRLFQQLLNQSNPDSHFVRAVCLGNRVIGFVNDVEIQDGTIELGYVIHPDFQGRGYATEALTASIQELFRLGYSTVLAGYFEENTASGRVMEKSGMHPISREDTIEYRGIIHRCLYYEIENPFRRIGNFIRYLPATDQPLSAEVYFIQGKKHTYLYDVGNHELSLRAIQSLRCSPVAIISHYHADHTGNVLKADFDRIYVGNYTKEKLGIGTVVSEPMTIDDGITLEIIPCPSVHTPGSLILNVNREFALIGDLFFHRPPVSVTLTHQMMETLAQVDTNCFVVSHSGRENIIDKKTFLLELHRKFKKEESQ